MKRVIIESPLGNRPYGTRCSPEEYEANVKYARKALADSLRRQDEAPFGSHIIYPLCLDDATPEERKLGMEAGFCWGEKADLIAVYMDRGLTAGMILGIEKHQKNNIPIEYRFIE